jgi:integrase
VAGLTLRYGLVFTTRTGLPVEPRNLVRSFSRSCEDNSIRRIRVYALRHTTASLLKQLGVPPKDVDNAAKRDAITRLNKLLGGK